MRDLHKLIAGAHGETTELLRKILSTLEVTVSKETVLPPNSWYNNSWWSYVRQFSIGQADSAKERGG